MPSELPRREPYSLREALNRIETGPSPAPEFLRARSGAHRPDQRPPQRDGERPFEAPPAARRPSKPGMQRRRDPAFREMVQTGDEAPAGTKKARKAKPKPGRLTIAGYILLVGIAAGGLTFALVEVIETRAFTATGGEDKRGMTAPGGVHGGRQLAKDTPQLKLSALSGTANRPIPLGVDVNSPTQGLFVLVHGMPAGSRLTAGLQIRDGEWRVPLRDLLHAQVMPPQDYLGTLNLPVDLSNSDGRVIESKIQRLTWGADRPDPIVAKPVETVVIGSQSGSSPPGHSASQNVRQALAGDGPVQSFGERPVTSPRAESSQASRQIEAQELKNLMQRAETALENRDFAAARLLLRRAAEAGDPKAAIALAATYDPRVLKQLGALGAQANADRAREWYRKAADWGSPEAGRRLLELQQSPH